MSASESLLLVRWCILKSANLPFVVEFVIQSTLDARLHIEYQLNASDMFFFFFFPASFLQMLRTLGGSEVRAVSLS